MIEKINTNKIKGKYAISDSGGTVFSGGDDTIESIKLVADKLNELIDAFNERTKPVEMPLKQCRYCGYVFCSVEELLSKKPETYNPNDTPFKNGEIK